MTPCCAVRIVGMSFCISVAASMAAAQEQAVHPQSSIPPVQPRVPKLTVGAGFGVDATEDNVPIQTLSAQYHVRRNLIVAGDVTHSSISGNIFGRSVTSHEWATAADLLYSTEPRRVTVFVGGGGAVTPREEFAFGAFCPSLRGFCAPPTIVSRLVPSVHFTTGANVLVGGPIYAFTSMRLSTDEYIRFVGGVRVAVATKSLATPASRHPRAVTASPADAVGREVRITFTNGARLSQKLVSLTGHEVEVERHGTHTLYSIDDVHLIERTRHAARYGTVIGGIAGFVVGTVMCSGDCDFPLVGAGAVIGAMGAGIGAVAGALINGATASNHVLYSRGTPKITVAPMIAPKGAAMGVRWNW